ncbi:exosortase E/protease, VPEID-CTERM system [Dinoroseobacter sp. PD6]|uniref:exosortase E/protease, VPEID-CTERM system n=1 Tax=Dinoroseobacter sp. PD6 TaxID=3028384 RepID=UPI00237B2ED4|nr:exosortase E/protease, VPEID-CTERM system [Dinoroseobacter sp. PD6]MDD9717143.1 exosortase E/protease, VPEID-CTERM system [Dinoroseobacter sp. PD6]
MSAFSETPQTRSTQRLAWGVTGGLVVVELLVISLLYQHNFEFTCRDLAPDGFCAFASRIVPRILGLLAAFGVFAMAHGALVQDTLRVPGPIRSGVSLSLAGFALALAPWFFLSDAASPALVFAGGAGWLVGAALAGIGAALILAPWPAWRGLIAQKGVLLATLLAAGLALPELSDLIQPLWRADWVTEITFQAVLWVLNAVGYGTEAYPETKIIGILGATEAENFFVAVGPQCSGVEGFALISVFLTVYMLLFRRDLAFPHALLLFPIGIVLSWSFNVVRIAALLSLGYEVSPDLAIGGFHSHAGWLAFTTLSVGLILVARHVAFFNKAEAVATAPAPLPPFFEDPVAAKVLPFAIFMVSALLASTFSETPSLLYPFRALAMAAALALFWSVLRALPWRLDGLAVGSGLAIGVLWIVTGPEAGNGPPPFGALTGGMLALWITARVIGTSLLVPVIEELLFRGYLLEKLAPAGKGLRMAIAVVISAGLFAVLHDRWIAAGLAGLVFGALVYRSGNVTDAIVSHGAANASIAAWALATGAWHII